MKLQYFKAYHVTALPPLHSLAAIVPD